MVNIHRIFMSTCWEQIYPAVELRALTRIGSDHTPLVLDSGAIPPPRHKMFMFEKWWLEIKGFRDVVEKYWNCSCN